MVVGQRDRFRPSYINAERNGFVDELRGLSILSVMCLHFFITIPTPGSVIPQWIIANGYYGVTIFFVISGFLITSNTIKRYGSLGAIDASLFYRMRFARIYPLLASLIAVLTVLHLTGPKAFEAQSGVSVWMAAWTALTFQFNWYYLFGAVGGLAPWAPLWSLSIEEVFYIAFPAACLALRKRWLIVLLLIVLIIQAPVVRTNAHMLHYWSGCADALAIGCLTAILASFCGAGTAPIVGFLLRWGALGAIVASFSYLPVGSFYQIGPTCVALSAAIYLAGSLISPSRRFPVFLPITLMGRRSYELYLIHMPILFLMQTFFPSPPTARHDTAFVLFVVGTAIAAELIGVLFSDPAYKAMMKAQEDRCTCPTEREYGER